MGGALGIMGRDGRGWELLEWCSGISFFYLCVVLGVITFAASMRRDEREKCFQNKTIKKKKRWTNSRQMTA